MASHILGLLTSAGFQANSDRFNGHRREILHSYPNGGAPLTGILSMMPEEPTNDSIFLWYEKEWNFPKTLTRGTNPLTKAEPTDGDSNSGAIATTTETNDVAKDLWLKVDSIVDIRPGSVLDIGGANSSHQVRVTAITQGVADSAINGFVKCRSVRPVTFTATNYTADTVVLITGAVFGEGAPGAGIEPQAFERPVQLQNQCSITRTPFKFSGTTMQEPLKWDQRGPYNELAKDSVVTHMTLLERQLIWGKRATIMSAPSLASGGVSEVIRYGSGILEFLKIWDAGSTGITVDKVKYAPFGHAAATTDGDDNKRIIANTGGRISVRRWNRWVERVGRFHTNMSNEKLVLCGPTAIMAFAEMFRLNSTYNVNVTNNDIYGLSFVSLRTPFGNFHFLVHPLFVEDEELRGWCLILDVWSLKYRPLINRDTMLIKMRQNPGDDFRKDEYLTEWGLEMRKFRNNMLIENVSVYDETVT